jgi:hypothetical protein
MPDAVFVSALMRWTRTRSRRGASDLIDLRAVVYGSLVDLFERKRLMVRVRVRVRVRKRERMDRCIGRTILRWEGSRADERLGVESIWVRV